MAPVVRGKKGEHKKIIDDAKAAGFVCARIDGIMCSLDEPIKLDKQKKHTIELVVDRIILGADVRRRLADSVETALTSANGILIVTRQAPKTEAAAEKSAAIGLTNKATGIYGNEAISAMSIMLRVTAIGLYIVFGFTKGLIPVIGINYGTGNMERVKEAVRLTNKWGAFFCGGFALIVIGSASLIVRLFSHNASEFLRTTAAKALIYNGITFIFFVYQSVYCAAFSAMDKAKEDGILNVSRQGVFFFPLIFILPHFFGLESLLFVQPAADICTVVLTCYFVFKNLKRRNLAFKYE